MTCQDIGSLLDLYVEGELDVTKVAEVEMHLDTCGACRRRVTGWRQMSDVLTMLPTERPAPDLAARILARVAAETAVWRVSLRHTLPAALGALAAALMVIWLGVESLTVLQEGGGLEFVALFTTQPEMLLAYPAEALAALVEALPVVEFLLMLTALGAALFLAQHALAQVSAGHGMHMNGRA